MSASLDERRVLAAGIFVVACVRLGATFLPAMAPSGAAEHVTLEADDVDRHEREAASAVVGGLAPGDTLADLTVERVGAIRDGAVSVELVDAAGGGLRIWVRARSRVPAPGYRQTDDFDLSFGGPRPGLARLPDEEAHAAVDALAERITRARPAVPPELR